jgi:hypothetical protein
MSLIIQQYLHCAAELEAIAKLINAMNEFETTLQKSLISIECGPEIWFTDKLMGHIVRTDEDNNEGEWAYRPARGEDGST